MSGTDLSLFRLHHGSSSIYLRKTQSLRGGPGHRGDNGKREPGTNSDVDLEAGIIQVSRSWSSKNGFTSTKNQKTRTVPISGELSQFLKGLKLQRGAGEFVLPHLTEWSRGDAAEVTRNFCKSLGITGIRFHDLRATFITNLLSRGESLARVMTIVGHSDMETTNVYLRKAGIELKDATERLGYKVPVDGQGVVLEFRGSRDSQ